MFPELRVIDLTSNIAGPYCTKLLADAGADVVKVEEQSGDPLRRWSASGADLGGEDGALFRYLNTSKRSVLGGLEDDEVVELVDRADILVEDHGPGRGSLDIGWLRARNPALVVVSISPFGATGPWADRPATEFTLQAWCGSTGSRGTPDRPPIAAGGRIGEWMAGAYAAVGAVAAWRAARRTGRGEHVDVSMFECMSVSMNTFASVFTSLMGIDPPPRPMPTVELPSIEPTSDGYVGFCTIARQQFQDFLVMIDRPDLLADDDLANVNGRTRRMDEFNAMVRAWTAERTTDEIIELASAMRIPVTPVLDGRTVVDHEQFVARGSFVQGPHGFTQPRVPYRIGDRPRPDLDPAPTVGEHQGTVDWSSRPARVTPPDLGRDSVLPLEGVRIIDFTAFWAGPAATQVLGALGAEVVKIESIQRPDGMRFTSVKRPSVDQWWEWGPVFHGANANKRSVTLDLNRPEGIDLVLRLIADSDAVVENFSPRVMENFGLDWAAIHAAAPRTVMMRMPAFGLDGPWRDRTGFAQTMEQLTGMAAVTGYPEGPPLIPRGPCDPLAGMHAVLALLGALDERDRSGSGMLVEVTLAETALNVAAEPVVEFAAYGNLLGRHGNRSAMADPQGVYACRDGQWVALAAETEAHREAVRQEVGGTPDDETLAAWCADRQATAVVDGLLARGVPAAVVIHPAAIGQNPQLDDRGFFETLDHPVTGRHALPSLPFRFAGNEGRWLRSPAPTLGQHNDAVLRDLLGLTDHDLDRLRAETVIGERPTGL